MLDFPASIQAELGDIYASKMPAQGDTSTVVVVMTEHGRFVVKRSVGAQYSAWVEREHRVLTALATLPLPVPRPHVLYTHTTNAGPEAWLVMDWLPGETVRTVLRRERDRAMREQIVSAWARSLAALHATPPPFSLDAPRSWIDRTLEQAAYNLEHFAVDGDEHLLRHLQNERPGLEPHTLIHGDFTLDNTLVSGGEVTGIIDWSGGTVGDPRYDLVLATRIKRGVFGKRDEAVFWDSYGRAPVSPDERAYFNDLYEFF